MKKCLPLLYALAAWCAPHAQAQTWCPSGAEWTQSYYAVDWNNGDTWESFILNRYTGDTLIGGMVAQRIVRDLYSREPGSSEYILDPWGVQYTSHEDGVVFRWSGAQFDTLLWFGAGPGDHWRVPDGGGGYRFLVNDTATVTVDGVPLRRSAISMIQLGDQTVIALDTLYERIGFIHLDSFVPLGVLADGISIRFLCYGDQDLSFTKPGVMDCGFTVNVEEAALANELRIWPNPGSDVLHIETGRAGWADVRVLDGVGQAVFMASSPNGSFVLDGSSLAPGIYLVEMNSIAGRRTEKWMKR